MSEICLRLAVFALIGNIIGIIGHQEQIVAAVHVERPDDTVIKCLSGFSIFQLAIPQSHEKPVFLAVRHLLCGEHDVNEVLALCAGQRLFQEAQILF